MYHNVKLNSYSSPVDSRDQLWQMFQFSNRHVHFREQKRCCSQWMAPTDFFCS